MEFKVSYICQSINRINSKGFWFGNNPLEFSMPLLLLQLSLMSIVTQCIYLVLKPLGQTAIVSQILVSLLTFIVLNILCFILLSFFFFYFFGQIYFFSLKIRIWDPIKINFHFLFCNLNFGNINKLGKIPFSFWSRLLKIFFLSFFF